MERRSGLVFVAAGGLEAGVDPAGIVGEAAEPPDEGLVTGGVVADALGVGALLMVEQGEVEAVLADVDAEEERGAGVGGCHRGLRASECGLRDGRPSVAVRCCPGGTTTMAGGG